MKKRLLYCHGLTFIDPLPYLLDYFRLAPSSDMALAHLPAARELLIEYAHLAPLIENGIVLPVSPPVEGGTIDLMDIRHLTEQEELSLQESLRGVDPIDVQVLARGILTDQVRLRKLEDKVDQVLPNSVSVRVFRQLLFVTQQRFTSRDILEPFQVSLLGSVPSINPDAVSVADIVRMRTEEELFADWRMLLDRVLKCLYDTQGQFSDLEREFAHVAREQVLVVVYFHFG